MLIVYFLILHKVFIVEAYVNNLFYIKGNRSNALISCSSFYDRPRSLKIIKFVDQTTNISKSIIYTSVGQPQIEIDPFLIYQATLNKVLFADAEPSETQVKEPHPSSDVLALYPSGQIMREELFQNKKMVHLPRKEWMHQDHLYLNTGSPDYLQTAVNAFAIFVDGSLSDVYKLPAEYVLRSARTISMMRIEREKLAATWEVVKGPRKPHEIDYSTLEYYRPLFKYVHAREISRLNLTDEKILSFIGTHPDLNRHQVGVVASEFIKNNKQWASPKYLNLMNNLLCGVPMKAMRAIPESVYLQLSQQVFYHVKACNPLQKRFYLAMMTRTQVLGSSNSWGARDVARLGLLLPEVSGPSLSVINPEAMIGITPQVMLEMPARNLKFLTEKQIRYLSQKPLNILTKKLHAFDEETMMFHSSAKTLLLTHSLLYVMVIKVLF